MIPWALARPMLHALSPETAHGLSLLALRAGLAGRARLQPDPILEQTLWGRRFANPLGLGAGYDKDAAAIAPLLRLGFGFVEVGTVTPLPQPGNPRPRLFRLSEDEAVINRLGFNSGGMDAAARNLAHARARGVAGVLGVNIGKNKESRDAAHDYAAAAHTLARFADYLVINVSSPNTPGLRALQGREELTRLIGAVRRVIGADGPPLLVKVSPDLNDADRDDVAALAREGAMDGLIVSNTTIDRPPTLKSRFRDEAGGLSGKPLFAPSTRMLAELYRRSDGRVPIIGIGGVASGADAYAKIRAGASLVALYSALVFHGPGLPAGILGELATLLRGDGCANVSQAVGADHR